MITFVTALYPEAKYLVDKFHLKKQPRTIPFDLFINDTMGIRLILTGSGAIAAATAVSALLATAQMPNDLWINIGSCAKPSNDLENGFFFCAKIKEAVTGRTFYPDLLLELENAELQMAEVITVPTVITSKNRERWITPEREKSPLLQIYDMEAAAIYQAASCYLSPHQMLFLKVATDTGNGELLTREALEKMMLSFYEKIGLDENKIKKWQQYALFGKDTFFEQYTKEQVEELAQAFQCSETMRFELLSKMRYAFLEGIDVLEICQQFFEEGILPVQDKRTGKKMLRELGEMLLATQRNQEERRWNRNDYCMKPPFSTIYIEEDAMEEMKTKEICNLFPLADRVPIHHYKDVFSRKKQSIAMQDASKSLILAKKTGKLVYEGAKVCQSFGNEHFYYTSCVMNCVYDCSYCYLKGMYPSGNLVLFTNLEDIFSEVEQLCKKHPVYLCVSYDTDLFALEHLTGYVERWIRFVETQENLRIEIRTKCGRMDLWETMPVCERVIFAFTLSPEQVVSRYERGAATCKARIDSLIKAYDKGFQVRLCFDPMILCPDWKSAYGELFDEIEKRVDFEKILDVSIGSFRISEDYLKKMRKMYPNESVVQYPYSNQGGVYQYDPELLEEMEQFLEKRLLSNIDATKIFRWK